MAFDVENVSSGSGAAIGSITFSHTITSANKLVVLVATGDSDPNIRGDITVTFNGDALTFKGEVDATSYTHAEIWERDNPDVGTFDVVVTCTAWALSANEIFGAAIGFTDAHTTSGAVAGNTGTTTNPSVTANSVANDIVVGVVSNDNNATAQTEDYTLIGEAEDIGSDVDANAERRTATGATTVLSWTNATSGGWWAAVAMAVKPAVGGADARKLVRTYV